MAAVFDRGGIITLQHSPFFFRLATITIRDSVTNIGVKMIQLHKGDCLNIMDTLPPDHFDAAVTDPPYHLHSTVKRFGGTRPAPQKRGYNGTFENIARGFIGQKWDGGDISFRVETWAKLLRVLKPGAHLVAFNHSRTYHRMASAIEDAGFEIRDSLMWIYSTGFPKSFKQTAALEKLGASPQTIAAFEGWGTGLKPAFEPIVVARKPLLESSIARQIISTGTGALNIDAARVPGGGHAGYKQPKNQTPRAENSFLSNLKTTPHLPSPGGGYPANIIHDGSQQVRANLPIDSAGRSVARFFYSAKADVADRRGSKHPTVKPHKLMRWLCRLVCPRGGLIIDPFAGSGATAWAAHAEGFSAAVIERETEFQNDIARGISAVSKSTLTEPAPDALSGQLSLFDV